MANFIKLVYATLKNEGIDTKDMDTDEAVEKFKELQKKNGGKVGEKEGTPAEQKRLQELGIESKEERDLKQNAILRLVDTLKRVKKVKLKEMVEFIESLNPIELKINDKYILAAFDKYTAEKNLYTRGNSTHRGFTFKLNNIKELPKFIENSNYAYSKPEIGKESRQHKGVKEWHYFKNNIQLGEEKYDVIVNIRDKGEKQYIYEVTFK